MEQKVENRNLSKALEIVSKLIVGEEISRDSKETASLYDEYCPPKKSTGFDFEAA